LAMHPTQTAKVGDKTIEEFYWAGSLCVYVDNRKVDTQFNETVDTLVKELHEEKQVPVKLKALPEKIVIISNNNVFLEKLEIFLANSNTDDFIVKGFPNLVDNRNHLDLKDEDDVPEVFPREIL